jgi:hypothetical protein
VDGNGGVICAAHLGQPLIRCLWSHHKIKNVMWPNEKS